MTDEQTSTTDEAHPQGWAFLPVTASGGSPGGQRARLEKGERLSGGFSSTTV